MQLDNFVYGHKDRWILLGRSRFQYFPLLYYGNGPTQNDNEPARIDATYLQIRQRGLLKILPNVFGGGEVDCRAYCALSLFSPKDWRIRCREGPTVRLI